MSVMFGRDTICVLPTSGGKTACYIIPALCSDWSVLVFSPLKSLMQDQVYQLQKLGCAAATINSGQASVENHMVLQKWRSGEVQFLLVAPERMNDEAFLKTITTRKPDLIAIDEAHVGSEWADSFRPEYAQIGKVVDYVSPRCVLALTATAPKQVIADIRRLYGMKKSELVSDMYVRDNLILSSVHGKAGTPQVLNRLNAKDREVLPAIVYAATRKRVDELFEGFRGISRYRVSRYHAGMRDTERSSVMNSFMRGELDVIFATNAFGMGINKADIRSVIHADIPPTVENLQQEVGRAGRDGKTSYCTLFFDESAVNTHRFLIDMSNPRSADVKRVFHYIKRRTDNGKILLTETIEALASDIGLNSGVVSSATTLLASQGFISRDSPTTKVYSFYDTKDLSVLPTSIRNVLLGTFVNPKGDGVIAVDRDRLLSASGLSSFKKLETLLMGHQSSSTFRVKFPTTGKETKFIPVNFEGAEYPDTELIDHKNGLLNTKLNMLYDYHRTPDPKKHQFIMDYFNEDENAQ